MKHLPKSILCTLLLSLLMCIATESNAQIYYGYDVAGNRTSKTITLITKTLKKMVKVEDSLDLVAAQLTNEYDEPQTEELADAEIKIYPNPTHGMLRVDILNVELNKADKIVLFDVRGNFVKQILNLTESNVIDLSNSANGIYMMNITIGQESTTWRIIKE